MAPTNLLRSARRVTTTSVVTTLAIAATAVGLSVSGHQDVTRARVQTTLDTAFANLYVQQQDDLGRTGLTPESVHAVSTCDRGGPQVPDVGAGSDWICMMTWAGQSVPGKFELQIHSSSCYTASGPGSIIGSFTVTEPSGKSVDNPVYAFDVCFDPDGQPTT